MRPMQPPLTVAPQRATVTVRYTVSFPPFFRGFSSLLQLCDVSYGNVSFVGAHDSYAVGTNNLAANQDYDVTQQLNDGIRLLQMQAHNNSGTIQLCHTSCSLYNGGTLEDYLGKVRSWMENNTADVVTLLIVNSDNFVATEYDTVFKAASLDTLSYSPTSSNLTRDSWPTLSTLIDAGTRLITFLDNGADFASVPYLIDEFTNIWETAYDVTDTTFDCEVNRTNGDTSTEMYLINHFLDRYVLGEPVPYVAKANETNAVNGTGSLGAQVATCEAEYSRAPNFLLVDFYEYGGGSVFEVAATINGVEYSPTSAIATPKSTTTSSSNAGSSTVVLLPSQKQQVAFAAVISGIIYGVSIVI
ncbi:PLC-like phosphodiesterase [Guyanagaster necrorhizus]|uniref:PLC-like phosphodiesterase n=1 Tax=Guyanagaster necrorhizus TaxID=856835 RepID=A0A9P7W5M6_9AGAR|nr:PLC-like phosphodiesterase [Guyanagaster necrorhizus MCA 3950]KAG7452385.1 PLC-like phosphodiesterase [Guyanagaster necrorhizus MCA 3950]